MSEAALTEGANEHDADADRYAAELIGKHGLPLSYDAAVLMVAAAYNAGAVNELKWVRDELRGDAA